MNSDKLMNQIEHTISINGGNKHPYPISVGLSKGVWSVVIEINNRQRTFDVEVEGSTMALALTNALASLKRQFAAAA
jgi:hypothetical protein